jgi:hypothetical protein
VTTWWEVNVSDVVVIRLTQQCRAMYTSTEAAGIP